MINPALSIPLHIQHSQPVISLFRTAETSDSVSLF